MTVQVVGCLKSQPPGPFWPAVLGRERERRQRAPGDGIELPLAAPAILAGIKTAAVINIGTATLAAYIGAGGLGDPIVTGLALYDPALILEGAIPAALLAVGTELAFEGVEKFLIPKHLVQKPPQELARPAAAFDEEPAHGARFSHPVLAHPDRPAHGPEPYLL